MSTEDSTILLSKIFSISTKENTIYIAKFVSYLLKIALLYITQIWTAHEGNGGKLLFPRWNSTLVYYSPRPVGSWPIRPPKSMNGVYNAKCFCSNLPKIALFYINCKGCLISTINSTILLCKFVSYLLKIALSYFAKSVFIAT